MADLTLTGLDISVYTRVVRMALAEKGLAYSFVPADPFGETPDAELARLTPFNRVPVLSHDGFLLYETRAILRYIDAAFGDPPLTPAGARAQGRMAQVAGIVDSYGYWPLVRQVFSHLVYRPRHGQAGDAAKIATGLKAAVPVLGELEKIAGEGLVLDGASVTLADLHLAPMIAYFAMAPEGTALLAGHPKLARWFGWICERDSFAATVPPLPG